MHDNKISPEEVIKANHEAFVRFTLVDFQVLIDTKGVDFVMNSLDEDTFRKMERWFEVGKLLRDR